MGMFDRERERLPKLHGVTVELERVGTARREDLFNQVEDGIRIAVRKMGHSLKGGDSLAIRFAFRRAISSEFSPCDARFWLRAGHVRSSVMRTFANDEEVVLILDRLKKWGRLTDEIINAMEGA